jgi:uncharacterized protein
MNDNLIEKTVEFVQNELKGAEAGHDWFHIFRVWNLAKKIAEKESVDALVVELAALLHDIADSKFHNGNEELGPQKARFFLESLFVDSQIVDHVIKILQVSHSDNNISYDTSYNISYNI